MKQLKTAAPGYLLDRPDLLATTDLGSLRGFGGLHGGLMLGMLASTMQKSAGDRRLRYVTGQFVRPAAGSLSFETSPPRIGRRTTRCGATLLANDAAAVRATAVFGSPAVDTETAGDFAPETPAVDPPEGCAPFSVPAEFVPFTRHVEIRPADANRPFARGSDPELTAWIRFVEDDAAPDPLRLITLLDALAPSYAAVLDQLVGLPTVELSVRVTGAYDRNDTTGSTDSPWVLLRAVTQTAAAGWIDERIDAWSPSGTHLAAGTQVRLLHDAAHS